jgi:endoglucanase
MSTFAVGTVETVSVSQAGYSANAYKVAYVTATDTLAAGTACRVLRGGTVVLPNCQLTDKGSTWGSRVYEVDFTSVTSTGETFTVEVSGVQSQPFPIAENIWDSYKDEMTAFYRIQRASVATADVYPAGYSSVAPSPKVFHEAGHLDDARSEDGTAHYDLTGGWYDAGDYGKYGGNQWVGGEIALAYLRHADTPAVRFDNDSNGVPDLIDEARVGSEYLMKFADQLGGALYNIRNNGGFRHPEHLTDNVPGTSDDRALTLLSVGGSAKGAGTLAATARAIRHAVAEGHIGAAQATEMSAFADECEAAAVILYTFAEDNPNGPEGSYTAIGGIPNTMLWAEVQLFLLTGEIAYRQSATDRIAPLTFDDLRSTNYWDLRPLSMAEFYPVADAGTQQHIHDLLRQQLDFFLSSTDDTPYGVLNQFKNFGVNEPHMSYVGDALRYYELFGDPAALRAVLRGMYWVFGANPWDISWVSGIGANHVKYLHTRLDEESYSQQNPGVVIPGAMVSGPNIKDPKDNRSAKPWYEDRPLWQDDTQQWRYNEYSISIQVGMLYSIMGLTSINDAPSDGGSHPAGITVTSPTIGDLVTGSVTIFAEPAEPMSSVRSNGSGSYLPMTLTQGSYRSTFTVDGVAPYAERRADVRGVAAGGRVTHSSTHFTVAPPLPTPTTPLMYDDFSGGGTFGGTGQGWVNWWNDHAGTGSYARATVDGRQVGRFSHNPQSAQSRAKMQPWHDRVDLSGYRYLSVTMKNPGYPAARIRIDMNDGQNGYQLTGGFVAVDDEWTTTDFDLDAFPNLDKSSVHIDVWLNQTGGEYGEILIDDIQATNKGSGTAPQLTNHGVSQTTGNRTTDFTFSVTYTDVNNQPPFTVDVVVDGVIHAMDELDPNDTTYADGKDYTFTTRLPVGQHSYFFRTTDTTTNLVKTVTYQQPVVSP